MIIPNTKRHPNNTKTDQLPISEVITGLPRPYHHTLSKKHQHLKIKWVKKSKKRPPKKNKKKENGTLAGTRTRVFKLKGAPKLFGPAACFFSFFGEKFHRVTHGACTRVTDTRQAARPQTWIIMYPKPVPAHGTQSCG